MKHTCDIIHLTTGENPIQVIVDAVVNSGPREDSCRIGSAGVVRRQAIDVSPLRRVNTAIHLLTTGARDSAFRNIKTIAECLAFPSNLAQISATLLSDTTALSSSSLQSSIRNLTVGKFCLSFAGLDIDCVRVRRVPV